MIIPDVNVLVYVHREDTAEHGAYVRWLQSVAAGSEPFVLTSMTVAGFVRIVTHPKVFTTPSSTDIALEFVDALVESPICRWLEPGDRWLRIFSDLCSRAGARGNLVPDAALAATAIEHGCNVATADRGFARFPALRWFHPLEQSD